MKVKLIMCILICTQLCFAQHQDCYNAMEICEYGNYYIPSMDGNGYETENDKDAYCINEGFIETNSFWFTFQAESHGKLNFVIDPIQKSDDIDFILYRTDKGCYYKQIERCMASGPSLSNEIIGCLGTTGLNQKQNDHFESQGCNRSKDSFLESIDLEQGTAYLLLVNNFSSTAGFNLLIEGDTKLTKNEFCSPALDQLNAYISPNPVQSDAILEFSSDRTMSLELELISPLGNSRPLERIKISPGESKVDLDLKDLSPGIYFIRILQASGKMQLLKFVKI